MISIGILNKKDDQFMVKVEFNESLNGTINFIKEMKVEDLPKISETLSFENNDYEVINVKNLKTPLKPDGTYYVVELRLK